MPDPEISRSFEDALRTRLAELVERGPAPDDARLDALEARALPPTQPRPRGRTLLAIAAVVAALAVLAAVAALVVFPDRGDDVRTGPGSEACEAVGPSVPVPSPYRDEPRLLVPLQHDLGQTTPTGAPAVTADRGAAELRYDDGTRFRFTTAPGDPADAVPLPFPTSRAEVDAAQTERARAITSGMTASGAVTTVDGTIAIQRHVLAALARTAAELPETMATAIAAGRAFPELEQTFAIGDERVRRTIQYADGAALVAHELTSRTGGVGGELSMLVGAERPETVSEWEAGGRYHWLVFVPAGLEVRIDPQGGDACAAAVADDLTGGRYWLIRDGDGDERVRTRTTTTGRPTAFALTRYEG